MDHFEPFDLGRVVRDKIFGNSHRRFVSLFPLLVGFQKGFFPGNQKPALSGFHVNHQFQNKISLFFYLPGMINPVFRLFQSGDVVIHDSGNADH